MPAAIIASVVKTTWWPGRSSQTTLSWPSANFLHRTCIAGLVRHLYGCISEWMAYAPSPFAHRRRITECCSLRDAFSGNAVTSNVHKWRHSDVIVINSQLILVIKFLTKRVFQNFHIWKINRIVPFCNLFVERSSYHELMILSQLCWIKLSVCCQQMGVEQFIKCFS